MNYLKRSSLALTNERGSSLTERLLVVVLVELLRLDRLLALEDVELPVAVNDAGGHVMLRCVDLHDLVRAKELGKLDRILVLLGYKEVIRVDLVVVELAQLERLRSELLDQVDLPAHLV